ncbi:MAG: glutamate-cysteine ligase family protein [Cytophagales bacterium]
MAGKMHLFEGFGIELEYMIVNRDSLDVMPIADKLLEELAGELVDDYENGPISISNELVLHVIELKCTKPITDLIQMEKDFVSNIHQINAILKSKFNARLMPGAAHPWMNPKKETFLWPHGNSEVYERYNKIFDCSGHGWSNLQSMHINLPFYNDEEFARLHTACRLVLPIIPSLSASSPILDKAYSGVHDKRLIYYQNNQKRMPSFTAMVIPDLMLSEKEYEDKIYKKIEEEVKLYNEDGLLKPVWLNSRGIISRFDRGSIEIRIIDIQECPKADLAIASLVIHLVKLLTEEKIASFETQKSANTQSLYNILQVCIKDSSDAIIDDQDYLQCFAIHKDEITVKEFWKDLLELCMKHYPEDLSPWYDTLCFILEEGTLASRLLKVANSVYTENNLKLIYQELSQNLPENKQFDPCVQYS